jgi:hypothetical protein
MIALLLSFAARAQDAEDMVLTAPEPAPPEEEARFLRYEINFEGGSLANSDPIWDFVGGNDGMPSYGFSGGVRLIERLAVVGSWQHVRRGSDVSAVGDTDTDADFEPDIGSFVAAYFGNEYTLGAKGDLSLADGVFLPFVSASALLLQSQVKLDGDLSSDDPVNEAAFSGVAPGFLVMGGGELRFPPRERVQVGLDLELGYGWVAKTDLDELGEMKAGGFAIRSAAGVRF